MPRVNIVERVNAGKPPRLRFKPGAILRQSGSGELFTVRAVYRTRVNPHEWIYVLDSGLTTHMSRIAEAVEAVAGSGIRGGTVCREPLCAGQEMIIPGTENFYWYGDVLRVPTRRVLREFTEVVDGPS